MEQEAKYWRDKWLEAISLLDLTKKLYEEKYLEKEIKEYGKRKQKNRFQHESKGNEAGKLLSKF